MAKLRDYKNKDFSLTLNKRMNGIELRFVHKMSEEQISLIKDAGFKWSKRQQMWYAYQNDKSIACATSLVDYYENTISSQEVNQKVTEEIESIYAQDSNAEIASLDPLKIISVEEVENNIEEITVNELAELVRQRAELDKKINAIREVLDNKGKKIDVSSEQAREFVLEMNEAVTEKEDEILLEENKQPKKEIELSIEDLEIVKRFIPEMEYSTLLDNATHGEESEYFKKKIKHIADMGHIIYENKDGKSYNEETKLHDKGFVHYFIGNSDWYVCEVDDDNIGFGFVVLNGDTQNAEYGYIDLNEVTTLTLNGFVQTELDIYIDDRVSMEQAIVEKYPELKNELFEGYENPVEAENGQAMSYADAREWNEEQRMQYSQEEDGRGAKAAVRDFDTVRKLEGIVSEIKDAGFTLESKYENEKHAVTLKNKSGEVIFSARENDNIIIPVERTIAVWANDGASEKAKTLADEFFRLVCEDGIHDGDYVNNVFTSAKEISENKDYIYSEESVPPVSASEIEEEKLFVQRRIQRLKDELNNPDVNNPDDDQYISETKRQIELLENMTDDDFKNLVVGKKEQQKKNEENHSRFVEQMIAEKQSREIPQEGELLSYNEMHPTYSVINKKTNEKTSIQPRGRLEENVKKLGKLSSLTDANNVIEKIKSSGFEILSTESRVIIFNEDKYYDFDSGDSSYFNYTTNEFEFTKKSLSEWDFKKYIKGGLKITKQMKAFEKNEFKTVNKEKENEFEIEIVNDEKNLQANSSSVKQENSESVNKEKTPVIYFNDLSPEQKEEVINGYRSADDQDMLTEWENVLRKNLTQTKKDSPFISSFDIEKEISVAANPPSDEWISEYLQKNKVNFNSDFWQDIFAEMEAPTLKESDVKDLEIVSDEEFSGIVDSIILNDYKNIPNAIRLPNLNAELLEKLGLEKNSSFILKKSAAHIRPDRKNGYGQAFDTEEYREIPEVIRTANFAVVDNYFQNFQIVFDDKNNSEKINKIVFNKDELGNYLVTVGKVERESAFSEERNSVVAVGVAPTIQTLRTRASSTALRASATTDELNIAQESEKSSFRTFYEEINKKPYASLGRYMPTDDELKDYERRQNIKSWNSNELSEMADYARSQISIGDASWQTSYMLYLIQNESAKRAAEKSSVPVEKQKEPLSKSQLSEIRSQCREILRKPDSEITEDDKAVLAKYEGAGGLNEDNRSVNGVLNEFYTPQNLVEKVWKIVDHYAPDAKTVLEPSAGVGKFANNRPNNKFTMHELDETSARINKILHPEADVIQGAFQKQFLDDGERFPKIGYEQPKHDVVIGNPPYGKYNDKYKGLGEGKEFDRYEEYFISKGLNALKNEKSVMAFVVPSGFLNSENDKIKNLIASQGELIDAYRLPEGIFPTTKVGTDIIVMKSWDERKRALNERARGNEAYQKLEITSWTKREAYKISGGQWFKDHPEKILGKTVGFTDRFGKPAVKVVPHDGLSVQDELDKIDGFLPQNIEKPGENHSRKMAEPRTEILSSDFKGFRNIADRISAIDESAQNRIGAVKIKTDAQAAEEYFSFMKSHIDFAGSLSTSVFNELENRNRHTATAALSIMGFFGKENQEYFAQRSEKNRENPDSYDFPPETVAKEINLSRGQRTPEKQKIENVGQPESNPQTLAANFVLEKLKAAGIEVVTDKEEFERILEREKFLQKMAGTLTPEEQKRYFTFNEADTAKFKSQVDEWKKSKDENQRFNPGKLIEVGEIPPLFKALGIADNPIEVQYSTLSKMVRPLPEGYPNEAQGHALSADDIYAIPSQLADPVMVFKSRTRDDSYVFFTERKDSQNHSILIPIAVNKRKGRIVINEITSMYGKDNEIDFVKTNIDEGNLIYADKKRSLEWERECKVQFLTQGLPSQDSIDNILTKERLVNFISANSQKRTPVQKMALASDRENVYGFAYEGKIYLNPGFLSSNVAVHEYTHLWDEYTRRTNPELWQKGMSIFKDTKFFNEVKNEVKGDPNYADIANDDNLVLSEVHARICGDMAQKTLERIAKEDGEITKDKAVDWNEETAAYILDFLKKANPENEFIQEMEASEIRKDMIEFFSMPMKDLMNGKNISMHQEKEKEQPSQRTKPQNVELQSGAIDIVNAVEKRKESPQSEKSETSQKQKSKWSITKSKGEVMSAEEFAHLYGRDFDEREFPIWRATDWQGIIDRTKLSYEEENLLYTSKNYVEIEPGEFTHKVLFESGDISSKIESYKNKITFLKQNEDERKRELYKKNIAILEKIAPPKIPMERLHFCVNSTLAEEFTIEHINSEGEIEKLNLQESFILWAKGQTWEQATSRGSYWRNGIDFTTANISEEDFPQNVTWYDIVEYIDRKSVKAERVSTWRKSDAEINEEKAQKRKEAEEKRMARSETADRLFDKYLHEGLSSELSAKVEAEYNRRFNSYVIPDYSKLPIFIDGMSREKDGKKFKLYDQQIKGVSFLCNKGNGLLAYDVGVGKTAAGIVATVNQIQTGRSKRPLIVVPNTVYPKWYENIQALFPNIKVNDLYNLNKESSSKYRNAEAPHKLDIPENSISLVTYEALKNITFTDTSCENELFEDYSKLLSEDFEGSARENAQNADKIKSVIGAASQIKNSDYVFFEDCGFDNILVDEAHNFKNLWTVPRPKSKGESNEFSGIPTSRPSVRALKLFAMTQLTQRHNDDRNVFLLTATPFVNSPLEVYSMISYVGRKRLVDSGIYSLRDFCTEFAHTKLELGVNAKGEIDQKQVMKDWKELPALQKILTEFIDKVDGEELKEIIRPKKFTHVQEIEMSDLQKKMMQIDTEKMSEVKEGNSAAVIVSMNAMRVALVAPALAEPARYPELNLPSMKELVETSPKLKFVCDSVIEMYKNNHEKGQFIYMPLGQAAHGIVKDYLIAHGLPNESVEIINGSINNTTDKKAKITEKFNDPNSKCKILIGGKNTSEGIDLNGNSFVMYNCSLGWNPSETIQAEGRIWRQGNQQGHVHCVYPVMNDSIDSLLYQKHDEKRSRINEIWTYKAGDTLNVEDINPEELKFELIKDPQKRAKLILENGIDTPDYKFTGTKHIQNDLNKVNSRIKSFEEVEEKRKKIVENLRGVEINIGSRLKNIEDYKNRNLEVPEWCKLELKEDRKFKESYEHQLETINRKYVSWGIKEEKAIEDFIPKMNAKKHELERELNEKENELPKILEKEMLKLKEKKILLPPITEQCKILTENIEKNLRPMSEVEPEIRTLRFEQMLSQKWEKGEISKDEKDLYLSVGYKRYYEWLDGEIDTLEETKIIESSLPVENTGVETMEVPAVSPSVEVIKKAVDKEIEQNQPKETYNDCGLFSDQEMAKLEEINKVTFQEKKNHQLITYSQDGGVNEKLEYSTLSEAQKAGKEFLKNWELDKADNGFVVFNKETKQIESTFGYFPVEEAFSKEVLLTNGYQVLAAKESFSNQEIKVSEIANAVKEQLSEQNDSQKHVEDHISFTGLSKPKISKGTVSW